jgi:hypothetical protein
MSPSSRNRFVSIGLNTKDYGMGVIEITFHNHIEKNTLEDVLNIIRDFHDTLYNYFLNNDNGQTEFPVLSHLIYDIANMLTGKASVTINSNMRGMSDEQIKDSLLSFFANGWQMAESEIVFFVFKSEDLDDLDNNMLNMKEEGSCEKLRNLINI